MEPGSLPAGLAPQGATISPDSGTGEEEDDDPGSPPLDDEDDD
jgi:hypothetical protein